MLNGLSSAARIAAPVVLSGLWGCASQNAVSDREKAAAEIPECVRQFGPAVVASVTVVQRDVDSRGKLTGMSAESLGSAQLLPNGLMLTAAHVFDERWQKNSRPLIFVNETVMNAEVVYRDNAPNDTLVFRPNLARGAFPSDGQPTSLELQLMNPLRSRIRFDGTKPIARGTTLYAFGYVHAPELDGSDSVPVAFTIVKGTAIRDFGPQEAIFFRTDAPLRINGMSGGPVAVYDEATETLTVVGLSILGGQWKWLLFHYGPVFVQASRLPPGATGGAAP